MRRSSLIPSGRGNRRVEMREFMLGQDWRLGLLRGWREVLATLIRTLWGGYGRLTASISIKRMPAT
jgi:hypothetical protein